MLSPRTKQNLRSQFRENLMAKVGIVLIVAVLVGAVFAPVLAPHNPTNQNIENNFQPPVGFGTTENQTTAEVVNGSVQQVTERVTTKGTLEHPLGTDALGRDILSRLFYGARTSALVGVLGTLFAVMFGVPVGLIAGYFGGRIDDVLMRIADIMLAFPGLVFALTLLGLVGPAKVEVPDPIVALGFAPGMPRYYVIPGTVTFILSVVVWVWFARVARGEALSVREENYVTASRSFGAKDRYTIRRHVLPNSITPVIVLATIQVAALILLESSLSFLGFSGTTLTWGFDIAQGRDHLATAWWLATFPGIAILLTVIGINLVGDWFRDALDPGIGGEGGGGGA